MSRDPTVNPGGVGDTNPDATSGSDGAIPIGGQRSGGASGDASGGGADREAGEGGAGGAGGEVGEAGAETDGIAPAPTPANEGSGPLLALLARGLELWLRQQCEALDTVQIQLKGSALQLLRGRLEGVSLTARGVIYEAMEIDHVELHSGPIRVRMGPLLRHQSMELENAFPIHGVVGFSGEGLDRSLRSPRWHALAGELVRDLLGAPGLGGVEIAGDRLRLHTAGAERTAAPGGGGAAGGEAIETLIEAVDGTLELRSIDGCRRTLLTMDPKIRIRAAEVREGWLRLTGEAHVSP